jgi:hypothetical protein
MFGWLVGWHRAASSVVSNFACHSDAKQLKEGVLRFRARP